MGRYTILRWFLRITLVATISIIIPVTGSPESAQAATCDASKNQVSGGSLSPPKSDQDCYDCTNSPTQHEADKCTVVQKGNPSQTPGSNNSVNYDKSVDDNAPTVCQAVETNQDIDCAKKIKDAYGECKNDSGVDKTNAESLAHCVADKTGYDETILANLFQDGVEDPAKSNCKVGDGIGWIICPTFGLLAKVTDGIFNFLSYFLRYDSIAAEQKNGVATAAPTSCFDADQPIECAWSQMRNLANVVFVLMFVVIIYSQVTGFGFSNYNVKKMLPRLIVASVLVNVSYSLCALAIDLSNVVGVNIYNFLTSLLAQAGGGGSGSTQFTPTFGKAMVGVLAGSTLIAGLAIGGALLATLAFLVPIMLAALCAALIVIAILIGRQMIISILIVISPIALVLYLLPNTAKWFDKWKDMFISMLLLYPLVGLVFGGATFAANVIRISDSGILMTIFALALQTIPLFIVPTLLATTGGMLGKVGAITNDKTKGIFDRTNNRAQSLIRRRQAAGAAKYYNRQTKNGPPTTKRGKAWNYMRAGTLGRQMNRDQNYKDNEDALATAREGAHDEKLQDASYAKYLAGGDADLAKQIEAKGILAAREQEEKDMSGLGKIMEKKTIDELTNILHNKEGNHSQEEIASALQQLIKVGEAEGANGYAQFIDKYQEEAKGSENGTVVTRATAAALRSSPYLGGRALNSISNGNAGSFRETVAGELAKGISAEKLAGASTSEANLMHSIAGENATVASNLGGAARAVQGDAKLNGQVGATRGHINTFSRY